MFGLVNEGWITDTTPFLLLLSPIDVSAVGSGVQLLSSKKDDFKLTTVTQGIIFTKGET